MTLIIIPAIVYFAIGGTIFFLISLTDEFNRRKWIPTFVLSVFLWPLILLAWGIAALVK